MNETTHTPTVKVERAPYLLSALWYNENGELHRLDGPAKCSMMTLPPQATPEITVFLWLRNGVHTRKDGPATVVTSPAPELTMFWMEDAAAHRLDGPATTSSDGEMKWWLHNDFLAYTTDRGEAT